MDMYFDTIPLFDDDDLILGAIPLVDHHGLSDDIWEQYQIGDTQLQSSPTMDVTCWMIRQDNSKVENDCMWNGHKTTHEKRMWNNNVVTSHTAGNYVKAPAPQVASQHSVLKPALRISVVDPNAVVPITPSYHYSIQTPPISDDEDTKPTQTLQNLQTAIFENFIDDDDDLSDYFKGDDENFGFFDEKIEEEEEEEEEEGEEDEDEEEGEEGEEEEEEEEQEQIDQRRAEQMRAFYAAESDHSYHKGNHGKMRPVNLGIETPSDSEEEIDVVSLGDKFSVSKAAVSALPTNPSTKDRRQLQRTMQNRFPQGIKAIMPVKRSSTGQTKSKISETRGAGRSRQYKRVNQNHRQYKKRCVYGHSSDSEPEPSEKRNLHNNMERQRRIDLRNLFNDLKKLVPEVNKKQRAAKVLILRGAAQYCRDLANTHDVLERRVDFLRKQQAHFRNELSKLRRDFAAKR